MADALDKIRAGIDKANTALGAVRLGNREYDVYLRSVVFVGAVPEAGVPGIPTPVDVLVTPRPAVVIKDVFRWYNGGPVLVGDAEFSKLSRTTYLDTDLLSADSFVVNGDEYTLVDGSLRTKPTEFYGILKKRAK